MLCRLFLRPPCPHQLAEDIDAVAERTADGVEDDVVDVGGALEERQLQKLDAHRHARAGEHDLSEGIQPLVDKGQDRAGGHKEQNVAEKVQPHVAVLVLLKVDERDQIDLERKQLLRVKDQRQHLAVLPEQRKEHQPHQNREVDEHQQKLCLLLFVDSAALDPHADA